MNRLVVLLALSAAAMSAHAQTFSTLVGLKCNPETDRLIIYYITASNRDAEAMLARKGPNEWEPGPLILSMKDDDHIGAMKTIVRNCKLKHGTYEIRIGPSPGNMNIQGECGAELTAWVEVRRGPSIVVPRRDFEPWCQEADGDVLTRVTIDSRSADPRLKFVKSSEFFR